jgi:DNA-binding transcriptional MerR regulator
MPAMLTIGELSRRSGVSQSALRFYERQGLSPPSARTATSAATRA